MWTSTEIQIVQDILQEIISSIISNLLLHDGLEMRQNHTKRTVVAKGIDEAWEYVEFKPSQKPLLTPSIRL